jgi:hypothetical protein
MKRQDMLIRDVSEGGPSVKIFTPSVQAGQNPVSTLIDRVAAACNRLAPLGWHELLKLHGLDIAAKDLASELSRPLPDIDRSITGFEDFAWEATRGIEPGKAAFSLLFHAFASPHVVGGTKYASNTPQLRDYPTPAEIEAVENFVYGVSSPSIEELRVRARGAHLAIVVFAAEYRPGNETVHRRHADMCYARSGVARVGTIPAEYLPEARGYLPFSKQDHHQFRTLPCRYSAYIAAVAPGIKDGHGPMRFLEPGQKAVAASGVRDKDAGPATVPPLVLQPRDVSDAVRNFWVPLHKLFDGPECIRDRDLKVSLSANHTNEKIRRAHLFFGANGHDGGWSEPDISNPPFIFHDGIAGFSQDVSDGSWLLMPVPHSTLIKAAEYKGKPLTYFVPESKDGSPWAPYQSSLNLKLKPSGARGAPEYLHARHRFDPNGKETDLNKLPDVIEIVRKGKYWARHYQDFSGDGWIDCECSELALEIPRRLPAYSIVATPDFFPAVNQSALMQWTEQSVPPALLNILWPENPGKPQALSDQRFAANLELSGAGFDPLDDTMTAIVGPFGSGGGRLTQIRRVRGERAVTLPDAAAGVFAPGWDVSFDRTLESDPNDTGDLARGTTFLNMYGLGSPFVEDTKLCAALSSFWPAVAPDVTRTFGPVTPVAKYATATPLTDDVIGLGSAKPWDGIKGPKVDRKKKQVEYTALAYGDYVEAALQNRFDISVIGATKVEEYVARTLTMARVYSALDSTSRLEKAKWALLSFRRPDKSDAELRAALKATKRTVQFEHTYRFEMIQYKDVRTGTGTKFDKIFVSFDTIVLLFADPSVVLRRLDDGTWKVHELRR